MSKVVPAIKAALANHATFNSVEVKASLDSLFDDLEADFTEAGYEESSRVEGRLEEINSLMDEQADEEPTDEEPAS